MRFFDLFLVFTLSSSRKLVPLINTWSTAPQTVLVQDWADIHQPSVADDLSSISEERNFFHVAVLAGSLVTCTLFFLATHH